MSEDQKFLEILKEIGKIIKEKNEIIMITDFRLSDVQKKLKDAEDEIEQLRKEKTNE